MTSRHQIRRKAGGGILSKPPQTKKNKNMKTLSIGKLLILAAVLGLTTALAERASAGTGTGVVVGGCTPQVGDDVEMSIHTPQNNDPSIGQKSGVKYTLFTVVQGGTRAGTSIKGGRRTALMMASDQKEMVAMLAALAPGSKDGAKLGMCKITKVSGSFKIGKGDTVTATSGEGSAVFTISSKGKEVGSFTITKG